MKDLEIKKSFNYNEFSFLKGNRPLNNFNLKNIKKSYADGIDLFAYNPILVDKNKIVYDGQHRFIVCKELGLPIYYLVIDSLVIPKLIKLNNAQAKWDLSAFVDSWASQGVHSYIILKDFSKKYGFNYAQSMDFLVQGHSNVGKARSGEFRIKSLESATLLANQQIRLINLNKVYKATVITRAIVSMSKINGFDFEKLYKRINNVKINHTVMGGLKEQIRYFEELYNKYNKNQSEYLRFF